MSKSNHKNKLILGHLQLDLHVFTERTYLTSVEQSRNIITYIYMDIFS